MRKIKLIPTFFLKYSQNSGGGGARNFLEIFQASLVCPYDKTNMCGALME